MDPQTYDARQKFGEWSCRPRANRHPAFPGDGSRMFGAVIGPNFSKTNWEIDFEGRCVAD
jgi:hypothetical protein